MPIVELRGGIIVANQAYGLPLQYAFPVAILGTMLPVPFILLLFKLIIEKLKDAPYIGKPLTRLHDAVVRKSHKLGKFELVGIALYVAIPIPGSGAWSAAMIASVLGLRIKHSLIAIFIGSVACAVIMSALSYVLIDGVSAGIAGRFFTKA